MARKKILRSPRLAEKARQRQGKKVLLLLSFSVLVVGGILYALSRPEFRITTIEISGYGRVPEDEIRTSVQTTISGFYLGVIPKSHTLFYPNRALKESLLKSFPTFSGVSVSLRSLSLLHVAVHEREPKAMFCATVQDCFLIDGTGFAFTRAEAPTEPLYYRLEREASTPLLGTHIMTEEKLTSLLRFLKNLEEAGLNPEKVVQKEQQELEVVLKDGTRLLLREGEYDRVLVKLKALIGERDLLPQKQGVPVVDYIDLRYGNKIYFKPR